MLYIDEITGFRSSRQRHQEGEHGLKLCRSLGIPRDIARYVGDNELIVFPYFVQAEQLFDMA